MRPRWLIVGLVASIALNLFLIGAGAGVVALGLRLARETPGARPAVFFWATDAMSQPARGETRRMLLGVRDAVRPDVERSRALGIQAWNGLAAATPDLAAIKLGLAQSRQIDAGLREKVEDQIVEQISRLQPRDRTAYASGVSRGLAGTVRR